MGLVATKTMVAFTLKGDKKFARKVQNVRFALSQGAMIVKCELDGYTRSVAFSSLLASYKETRIEASNAVHVDVLDGYNAYAHSSSSPDGGYSLSYGLGETVCECKDYQERSSKVGQKCKHILALEALLEADSYDDMYTEYIYRQNMEYA
jgi:hypothetical protein